MRNIEVEGVLEADAVFAFEGDPGIQSFTEQDPKLPVSRKGSSHTTMDFSVRRFDGSETFIEVKPESKLVDNGTSGPSPTNWGNLTAWASTDNYKLAFITDTDLAQQVHRISNWRRLLPFVRFAMVHPDEKTSCDVFQIVASHGQTTINEMMHILSLDQRSQIPIEVARLLHTGKLNASLDDRVFTLDTPITVTQTPTFTQDPTEPTVGSHFYRQAA